MNQLIEFYKIHYNFAALAVLVALWAFWSISRGNVRRFVILMGLVIAYNIGLSSLVKSNAQWFDKVMTQIEHFDFVDWIWDSNTASVLKNQSK